MCDFGSHNFVIHSPYAAFQLTFISTILQHNCHHDVACWWESAVSRSNDSTFCWLVHWTVPLTVTDRHTTALGGQLTNNTFIYTTQTQIFTLHTRKNRTFKNPLQSQEHAVHNCCTNRDSYCSVQLQTRTVRKYNGKIKWLFSHLRLIKLLIYPFSHLLKDYLVKFSG